VEIYYVKKKLQKQCNMEKEAIKEWGAVAAEKLKQRLTELDAFDNLADVSHLPPPRLHQLEGNRKHQFAVDIIKKSLRLVFIPVNEPLPIKQDGGIDKSKVTEIMILEVANYHG